MLSVFRHLLAVLVAFALVGGTAAQFAHSADYVAPMTMADTPCDMTMPMAAGEHGQPMMPDKGMASDCVKMCCMVVAALPAPLISSNILAHFSMVDYWPAGSKLDGLAREPEPVPPRTT
jgi:hypothetical protein